MPMFRRIAAVLTVLSGCAMTALALHLDLPHADGDGGFLSPGVLLAAMFGGAPIVTGIASLMRDR